MGSTRRRTRSPELWMGEYYSECMFMLGRRSHVALPGAVIRIFRTLLFLPPLLLSTNLTAIP